MMKENSRRVLDYLKEIHGTANENVTANDVADTLGLTSKQVNGIFTSAIQKKGLGVRKEAEVELEDGSHSKVKFLVLTDAGMAYVDEDDAE